MRRLTAFAVAMLSALPVPILAQEGAATRWPDPPAAVAAFQKGDFLGAREILRAENERCQAAKPARDECLKLLLGLSNTSGYGGDASGGEAYARAAVEVAERSLPAGHPDLALAWLQLGSRLDQQYRDAEAEPWLRKAVEAMEAARPAADPLLIDTRATLLGNLARQGRVAEAIVLARKELADLAKGGAGADVIARRQMAMADLLAQGGRAAEADTLRGQAAATLERVLPAKDPRRRTLYQDMARALEDREDWAGAEPWRRKALAHARRYRDDKYAAANIAYFLALNLQAQDKDAQAEPLLREVLAERTATLRPGHPLVAAAYRDLALNLAYQGKTEAADRAFQDMARVRPAFSTASDLAVIQWEESYADFLQYFAERPGDALIHYRAARDGVLARLSATATYDAASQEELRGYRPLFQSLVEAAWAAASSAS